MKGGWWTGWLMVTLLLPGALGQEAGPPPTRRDDVVETLHGREIVDPFRWLEDPLAPETRRWIDAQNQYTDRILKSLPGREKLKERIGELLRTDSVGLPTPRGGNYFFLKRNADQDQAVLYVRRGLDGPDKVLVDPHPLSRDHTTSVSLVDVSEDGTLVAYGLREGGKDEIEVRFRDVPTDEDLPDRLPPARYFGAPILADRTGCVYARHDKGGTRVFRHRFGEPLEKDALLFGEGYGPGEIIVPSLSDDGRRLLLTVLFGSSADKSELFVKDVARDGPIVPIIRGVPARFSGEIIGSRLVVQTNLDAPTGRILEIDLEKPEREHWKELVPAGSAVLEEFHMLAGSLVALYLENVQSRLRIFTPEGKKKADVPLPAMGSVGGVTGAWKGTEAFFEFSSFVVPSTIHRLETGAAAVEKPPTVWARTSVPVDPDRFALRQVEFRSKDGTRIPMFLVTPRDDEPGRPRPTYLTGYGGFNISLTPSFSPTAVVWVERGGIFAVPNLRGGGEFGEEWHKAGMGEKKQNVFDDFIAAAEWLLQQGFTSPDKLAIAGRSNGGLLVGAALTQRPELFRAVVCGYPLLDMVRYHRFLVARFWIPEYGSSEAAEDLAYLIEYSPYHRVKPGTKYPAVLFVTGDADTRVDPLHARKMTALMQLHASPTRPVLLHYDTRAGHSTGRPVGLRLEDLADELLFLLWQLGQLPKEGGP